MGAQMLLIFKDVFAFIVLLMCYMAAFSVMLYAVDFSGHKCLHGPQHTLLVIFMSALLDFGDGDDHLLECLYREGEWIMLTVFVIWLLFAAIQLFNLIIAIFTCNFETMGSESLARQNLE